MSTALPAALLAALLGPVSVATAAPAAVAAQQANPYVPDGAVWTQQYFNSGSGTNKAELHADILRPKNLPADAKTPVILSIGPYFSHFGSTGDEGKTQAGPSTRFNDLVVGGKLMERGYTFVMVDLRGFGGSTGCLDWMGPGEQGDVKAALDWAGQQPWSNGQVGMYGKSYDAATGLIGLGSGASSLKAVVSQEPVYDAYRYLYTNGLARPNHLGTPQAYDGISQLPPVGGVNGDDAHYAQNAAYEDSHPECVKNNDTLTQNPDHQSSFWKARNFLTPARGSTVPLFLTQGFIESNTKPEGVQELLQGLKGPVRGWLGQWDHVRGNETDSSGALEMGRAAWFDEVMRFYDKHLKGTAPNVQDPAFAIEGSDGSWRQQTNWPQAGASPTVDLKTGSYSSPLKSLSVAAAQPSAEAAAKFAQPPMSSAKQLPPGVGSNGQDLESLGSAGLNPPAGLSAAEQKTKPSAKTPKAASGGLWTASQPVASATRITGTPSLTVQSSAAAGANIAVELYDLAADGSGVLINSMVSTLNSGAATRVELLSLDWALAKGHSLAVRVGAAKGSLQVQLTSAKLSLSLQSTSQDQATQGDRSPYLDYYISSYTSKLPTIKPSFQLNLKP
ncbi:hypothetical protein UM93_00970 [Psychromicrobium lacuslunae]|uniref:Xaa-Pro dipeptidyl-peptidase C-terminal domain-containing protein n=1 Tax=Psychromicrobium lacuslunae TaxID=1618207 RepID=A0A0D4C258_9MICC|nr:hypothetical protein UM93_00970 [Psychromicrobium lacuslunae]